MKKYIALFTLAFSFFTLSATSHAEMCRITTLTAAPADTMPAAQTVAVGASNVLVATYDVSATCDLTIGTVYIQADPVSAMTSVRGIRLVDENGSLPTTASTAGSGINDGAYVFGPLSLTGGVVKKISVYADIASNAPAGSQFKLFISGFGTVPGTTFANSTGRGFNINNTYYPFAKSNTVTIAPETAPPAAPTCIIGSFTANPMTTSVGQSSTISWNTTGCSSVSLISRTGLTQQPANGSYVDQYTQTLVANRAAYTLKASAQPGCYGANYSDTNGQACNYVTNSLAVVVQPTTTPACAIDSFTANPSSISTIGQPSILSWTTTGCNSAVITHGEGTNVIQTSGSISTGMTGPLAMYFNPNTYTLKASEQPGCNGTNYSVTNGQACNYVTSAIVIPLQSTSICTTTPSITLTNPVQGGTYATGDQMLVTWRTCGFAATDPVHLSIATLDGQQYLFGLNNTPNDGQESIVVPTVSVDGNYNFVIKIDGSTVADSNEVQIAIQSAPGLIPGCGSGNVYSPVTGQLCGRSVTSVIPTSATTKGLFTRELKLGMSGADVSALQNRLIAEKVYTGKVTGYFGGMTQAALKKFQTKYGIPAVGAVGPRTLQMLNK